MAIVGTGRGLCKVDAGRLLAKERPQRRVSGPVNIERAKISTLSKTMVPLCPKRRRSPPEVGIVRTRLSQ